MSFCCFHCLSFCWNSCVQITHVTMSLSMSNGCQVVEGRLYCTLCVGKTISEKDKDNKLGFKHPPLLLNKLGFFFFKVLMKKIFLYQLLHNHGREKQIGNWLISSLVFFR